MFFVSGILYKTLIFCFPVKPQPFVFILPCLLVGAGVSDSVLISLLSGNNFPPKKEYSEPCTCFCFDILWLMF